MVFSESSMCGYLLSIERSCKVQATLLEILVQMKKKKKKNGWIAGFRNLTQMSLEQMIGEVSSSFSHLRKDPLLLERNSLK